MKNNEIETLTKPNGIKLNAFSVDANGDDHSYIGLETPLRKDAFKLSDEEKKKELNFFLRK